MPGAYQLLLSTDVVATLHSLARARRLAPRAGPFGAQAEIALSRILIDLEAELASLSRRTAAFADERIIAKIKATQRRPDTSKPHHLTDSIESQPGPVGSVEIALMDRLEQTVSPTSPEPYWRAQEYGLSEGFVGRRLFGTFEPSGEAPRPLSGNVSLDPEFVMGTQEGAGPGVIQRPIQARHFLRDGSAEAIGFYRTGLRAIEAKYTPLILGALVGA